MTLGDLVKKYRENHHISMDEFSKMCKLSKGYISMLENNTNPRNNKPIAPTLPTINKIASAMNTDVDSILKALDSKQEINLDSNSDKSTGTGIGSKLSTLMDKNGTNANELARKINVSPQTIYSIIKRDSKKADLEVLLKIADTLGVTAEYFVDEINTDTGSNLEQYSKEELVRLKQYHDLDPLGRSHVDAVLQWETERVKQVAQASSSSVAEVSDLRIIAYYHRLASAGRGDYLFDDIPAEFIRVKSTSVSRQADFVIGVNDQSMEDTYYDGDKVFVKKLHEINIGDIGLFTRGNDCFIKELGADRLISHNEDKITYPDIPSSDDIWLVGKVLGKVESALH